MKQDFVTCKGKRYNSGDKIDVLWYYGGSQNPRKRTGVFIDCDEEANEYRIIIDEKIYAEALFIRLDADVGLHHGSTHDDLKLVALQHGLQKAEGTIVGISVDRVFERFVDRYCIDRFSHGNHPFTSS